MMINQKTIFLVMIVKGPSALLDITGKPIDNASIIATPKVSCILEDKTISFDQLFFNFFLSI